tara:strand:- start:268 stop:981 length:714 start_codon:yes stop_codon:yes gene_type:complete
MPYYKKINYVEQSIDSVLNQSYQDLELIIIYDDENKEDLKFLKQIEKKNKKIKIIENTKNLGAGLSRNIGIKYSNGQVVCFIDSDDIWFKDKLSKQIHFMEKNNLDFIFCDYVKKKNKNETNVICNKSVLDYNELLKSCDIGLSTVMLKKKIIPENIFPNLKTKEDYVAWLKLTKENIKAYKLNEVLVLWNKTKNSLSSNILQKVMDGYKVYRLHLRLNIFRSIFYLLRLSLNSLKK